MSYTSIARMYANVNQNMPQEYWDYGILFLLEILFFFITKNYFIDLKLKINTIDNLQVQWG